MSRRAQEPRPSGRLVEKNIKILATSWTEGGEPPPRPSRAGEADDVDKVDQVACGVRESTFVARRRCFDVVEVIRLILFSSKILKYSTDVSVKSRKITDYYVFT